MLHVKKERFFLVIYEKLPLAKIVSRPDNFFCNKEMRSIKSRIFANQKVIHIFEIEMLDIFWCTFKNIREMATRANLMPNDNNSYQSFKYEL